MRLFNNINSLHIITLMIGIAIIALLLNNYLSPRNGIIATGDYVNPSNEVFMLRIFSTWYPYERMGVFNYAILSLNYFVRLYGYLIYNSFPFPFAGNIFFLSPIFIAFIAMYLYLSRFTTKISYLSRELPLNKHKYFINVVCLIISLYYAFNPWIMNRIVSGHLYIVYSYSFIPLLFMALDAIIERFTLHNIVYLVLLYCITINGIPVMLSVTLLMILYLIVRILISRKYKNINTQAVLKILLLAVLLLIINSPLLSLSLLLTQHSRFMSRNTEALTYPWLLKNIKFLNLIRLRTYWWDKFTYDMYSLNNLILSIEIVAYTMLIIISLVIIIKSKAMPLKRYILSLMVLLVIDFSITLFTKNLNLNTILISSNIILKAWSTVFRDPDKLLIIAPYVYSMLFYILSFCIVTYVSEFRKILKYIYIISMIIFIVTYTGINPLIRSELPLRLIKLSNERFSLYFGRLNELLKNNVLFLPTTQYFAYKLDNNTINCGNLNKYLLTKVNIGPPMDPHYDYSNISRTILKLQSIIYKGNMSSSKFCGFANAILRHLGIRTIVLQKDVTAYNYRVKHFIELLKYRCGVQLIKLYPNRTSILILTLKALRGNELYTQLIINGKIYTKTMKGIDVKHLLYELNNNRKMYLGANYIGYIYAIGLTSSSLNLTDAIHLYKVLLVTNATIEKIGNQRIMWIKLDESLIHEKGIEIYTSNFNPLNRTVIMIFKPLFMTIPDRIHNLLKLNAFRINLNPDERIVIALFDGKRWFTFVENFEDSTIEIYRVRDVRFRLFDITYGNATINHTKIEGYARYELRVHSATPFLLLFRVGFDPLWEAKVYKNNAFIETVYSIPIYGAINGFLINETGNLTIIISYIPQNQMTLYMKIHTFLIVMFIVYLVLRKRFSYIFDKVKVLYLSLVKVS